MRLLARIIWLTLWAVCVAEDCKGPPPRKNTEILSGSWSDQPYPEGTQAIYKCRPGYRTLGSIVKVCKRGEWVASNPSRVCRKRPCGHPGDTPFGSFRLTVGSEFEFGAKVVYTCDDGYQLLGAIDYRECDTDGWTNDIPLCEVVKCLPVTEPENGRIISDAAEPGQEYYFGQVVRFECNAGFKIEGQKEMHCSDNGRWSNEKPRCVGISCTRPEVEHGRAVSKNQVFKENERYQYTCNPGYVYRERGDAICTASGWSPQPFCEEMACEPPYIPNGFYSPHRIKHRSEDEIRYECKDGFYPATRGTVVKCTSTGWIPTPRCSLKPCDFPQFNNGRLDNEDYYKPYFPVHIGSSYRYSCFSGFVSAKYWPYIYCTEQGWDPAVPCIRQCVFHYVENGKSSLWAANYVQGQSVKVQCHKGYSLPNDQDTIVCTENGWSPQPKCIRIKTCSTSDIEIENGFFSEGDPTYALNRKTLYRCKQGYVTANGETSGTITCLQNGWSVQPTCIKSCDMPVFENAGTKNNNTWFKLNDELKYECHVGYENRDKHTKGSITCTDNGWSDIPSCYDSTGKCGPPPPIDNGDITSFPLMEYPPLSSVEYKCQAYYQIEGSKKITCRNGEWSKAPTCLHACVIPEEIMEKHNLTFKWRRKEKIYSTTGDFIEFKCKNGYTLATGSPPLRTTCIKGHINYPTCTKRYLFFSFCLFVLLQVKFCKLPQIKNGLLYTEKMNRLLFLLPTLKKMRYHCNNGFVTPSGSDWDYIRCTEEGWKPAVPCLRECIFHYVENGHSSFWERKYVQDQSVEVKCYPGYNLPNGQDTMTCTENGWSPQPKCIRVKTCSNTDIEIENGFFSESDPTYALNRETQYSCKQGYVTENGETSGTITCLQNGWSAQPSCIKACDMPVFENAGTKTNSTWFKLNDKLDYECHVGYENRQKHSKGSITCTDDGWSDIPSCYDSKGKCGRPPPIDNGDITSFPLPVYAPLSSVEYQCQSLYKMQGSKAITCRNGEWSAPPKCLHACIILEDIMERNNIILKWRETKKMYIQSGDNIEFVCKTGYIKGRGSPAFHTQCIDGHIDYPTCSK
ncbi:complement factor H-like [Acomys russatus]|uniref:complement factor H-like n=1 Tax=Acomys russatus TaxID=60746 RepID=UPI0021E240D0|nr:complement factor H-like [Acomys russatus]